MLLVYSFNDLHIISVNMLSVLQVFLWGYRQEFFVGLAEKRLAYISGSEFWGVSSVPQSFSWASPICIWFRNKSYLKHKYSLEILPVNQKAVRFSYNHYDEKGESKITHLTFSCWRHILCQISVWDFSQSQLRKNLQVLKLTVEQKPQISDLSSFMNYPVDNVIWLLW